MDKRICFFFFFIALTISNGCMAEKIPDKYVGNWSIELVSQSGFPWWLEVKYPVQLTLTTNGGNIVDQYGFECSLSTLLYDAELDIIVFKHCGIGKKSESAFEAFQVAKLDDNGQLYGQVKTYKNLFSWIGTRIIDGDGPTTRE